MLEQLPQAMPQDGTLAPPAVNDPVEASRTNENAVGAAGTDALFRVPVAKFSGASLRAFEDYE